MAERRMFSKAVVSSARFLRMPQTTRLLYYDLGMSADDDGVVEAFTVLRTTGAAEDDLRVLVSKGYVYILNEDLVSFIADWKQNNQIRKDRYHASIYQKLLVKLVEREPGLTDVIPDGNQWLTEDRTGELREDEDSSGKEREESPDSKRFIPPNVDEVAEYCNERQNGVDPQAFVDYYESTGWMRGKSKIKDWKACVRTWERNLKDSKETVVAPEAPVKYYTAEDDTDE